MKKAKRTSDLETILSVLRYTKSERMNAKIRRYYNKWRAMQDPPLPERCDNESCKFFTESLNWHGKKLSMILDHKNGNNTDNRPENLQLLCPNCDSQLSTRGGANRGRIKKHKGGFAIVRKDGKKDHRLIAESGKINTSGRVAKLRLLGSGKLQHQPSKTRGA